MAGGGWERPPEERVAKEIKKLLEPRDKLASQMAQHIENHRRAIIRLHEEIQGKHMTARDHYEAAAKYNGIVLTVGYAGFFGLWSMVKDQGHEFPMLHAWAALLVGVSLFIFVLWEVYSMAVHTVCISYPMRSGEPRGWFVALMHKADDRLPKAWAWQFVPALLTGVAGIGCLSWVLVANVAKLVLSK